MMEITRREEFSAAHRLFNPGFSDEKNEALYGPCANPNYHGHNYVVEVTLRGPVDPDTGMTFNLADLKETMRHAAIWSTTCIARLMLLLTEMSSRCVPVSR